MISTSTTRHAGPSQSASQDFTERFGMEMIFCKGEGDIVASFVVNNTPIYMA